AVYGDTVIFGVFHSLDGFLAGPGHPAADVYLRDIGDIYQYQDGLLLAFEFFGSFDQIFDRIYNGARSLDPNKMLFYKTARVIECLESVRLAHPAPQPSNIYFESISTFIQGNMWY